MWVLQSELRVLGFEIPETEQLRAHFGEGTQAVVRLAMLGGAVANVQACPRLLLIGGVLGVSDEDRRVFSESLHAEAFYGEVPPTTSSVKGSKNLYWKL